MSTIRCMREILLFVILAVVLAPHSLGAQAAQTESRRQVVGESYIEPPPPSAPELVSNLKDYMEQRLHAYYPSAQEIYDSASTGFGPFSYVRLKPVKTTPILAGDIAVYGGGLEALAIMSKDSRLRVWGKYPCSGLRMVNGPAKLLELTPNSPLLAALDKDRSTIRMVDLKSCRSANVWLRAKNKKIHAIQFSRFGDWVAVETDNGEIFAGPSLGPLKPIPNLAGGMLAFGFSSYDGVLIAMDSDGRIVFWGMRPGKLLGEMNLGKGFKTARIEDDNLILERNDGIQKVWNVITRAFVDAKIKPGKEHVKLKFSNGTLSLDNKITRWKKTVIMRHPSVMLYYSKSKNSLKLLDMDDSTHYYNATTGVPQREANASDWVLLPDNDKSTYTANGKKYRLADLAYQKGHKALFCRYVPRSGFFLWWVSEPDSRDFLAKKGSLPKRTCVLDDTPPKWVDLTAEPLP